MLASSSRGRPPPLALALTALTLVACGLAVWRNNASRGDPEAGVAAVEWAAAEGPPADAGVRAREPDAAVRPDRRGPVFPAFEPRAEDAAPVPVPIAHPERLDHFFERLTLAELGREGAIARAGHWGDSVIGGDGLTEAIRRKLQTRFGDAGHGFHILGKYNRWYNHRGIRYEERRPWKSCLVIFKCQRDMRYGYGGVTSTSRGKALSRFSTVPAEKAPAERAPAEKAPAEKAPEEDSPASAAPGLGERASRFELWYQKRPDGGGFELRVDGQVARVVDSRAAETSDAVEVVRVPDGEHTFEVAALGTGVAHGYGVVLERDVPGVVWDELSLIGSFTQRLDYQDAEHIAGQLRQRQIDLMVFMFGGNDLSREKSDLRHTTEPYEREYARVIQKFRAGRPEASCLIMSLTDHAERVRGAIVSRDIVRRLAEAQGRVAAAEGCAFFDTFMAAGGLGTIERWRNAKPPLAAPDLRHPTVAGQRHVAELLYQALMNAYASYRQRKEGQPLPPP